MAYLAILFSLIVGLELMGLNIIIIPFDYEIYMNYLFEKIEVLNPTLKYFKEKTTEILIKLGYSLLYGFSICQIKLNKMKNMLVPHIEIFKKYLKDNGIILGNVRNQIVKIIDKNGNIENMITLSDKTPLEIYSNIYDEDKHIGLVLSDKNLETGCINHIYNEKFPITKDYNLSKISFMMIELEYQNEKYVISLKDNDHNYYIVNNSLNKNFFKYYLKNILKVPINENDFDYKLTIIDHNVNFITILPHQTIIIDEHCYNIYSEEIDDKSNKIQNNTDIINNIIIDEHGSESDKSDDFVKLESTD